MKFAIKRLPYGPTDYFVERLARVRGYPGYVKCRRIIGRWYLVRYY